MRRLWIALPLAALLCLPAGAVEARELTPLKYDKIDLFNGDVPTAEVTLNGKLGALDAEGREVVPARYDQVWRYDDTTWTVALGDRWGTAGEGRELVPVIYDSVDMSYCEDGYVKVGLGGLYGYCDREGNVVVPIRYPLLGPYSGGRIAFARDGKWGYLDGQGGEVIPPRYEAAEAFVHGTAAVTLEGESFRITPDGERYEPSYEEWRQLTPTEAAVRVGEEWRVIDTPETQGAPYRYLAQRYGERNFLQASVGDEGYALLDRSGERALPENYDYLDFRADGYIQTIRGGYEGLVDRNGVELFKPDTYWDIEPYGGLFQVQTEEGYALLDREKKPVTKTFYEELWPFTEEYVGLMAFQREGRWGFLDRTGTEVIPPRYDDVTTIGGLRVRRDGEWFFLEEGGAKLPVPQREGLRFFSDGVGRFQRDGKWGYITREGVELVPPQYDMADDFSSGYAAVCRNGKWGYIDLTGREVVPPQYDGASALCQGKPGVAFVSKDRKYGLLDLPRAAWERAQTVTVDGTAVELQTYALKDYRGYDTNYVKLRDVASLLNGTPAQFSVEYDGETRLETGKEYTPNGSELNAPFHGEQPCRDYWYYDIYVDGAQREPEAILLTDENGGGYAYFKLRDLGRLLGFQVGWDPQRGVSISTQ